MNHIISSWGYLAVLLLMTLESACIPIPSEVIMLFAGALAAGGQLNLIDVIIIGTVGNLIGSYIAWGVGRTAGRAFVVRYGKYVFLKQDDLERAEKWFSRHGESTVFFSRLLPVLRTFISLPAGMGEMPPLRFGIYTLLGSLPWSAALAILGYVLKNNWNSILGLFTGATDLIGLVVGLAIAVFLYHNWQKRKVMGINS